jgi:hypothetical protein
MKAARAKLHPPSLGRRYPEPSSRIDVRRQEKAWIIVYDGMRFQVDVASGDVVRIAVSEQDRGKASALASQDVIKFAGKDAKEGLIESIGGISINFPASEKLDWISAKDTDAIDAKLIALGRAKESPAIAGKYTPVVDRYTTIGDYVLLCGHYDPPFPDGSFTWIISKKDMKYVGHFFDKDSR